MSIYKEKLRKRDEVQKMGTPKGINSKQKFLDKNQARGLKRNRS
jgi:hypothetical protein